MLDGIAHMHASFDDAVVAIAAPGKHAFLGDLQALQFPRLAQSPRQFTARVAPEAATRRRDTA